VPAVAGAGKDAGVERLRVAARADAGDRGGAMRGPVNVEAAVGVVADQLAAGHAKGIERSGVGGTDAIAVVDHDDRLRERGGQSGPDAVGLGCS